LPPVARRRRFRFGYFQLTDLVTALTIDADGSGNVVSLNAREAADGGGLHKLSILLASSRPARRA